MALCLTQSVPFAGDLVDEYNRLLDEASAWRAFHAGIGTKPEAHTGTHRHSVLTPQSSAGPTPRAALRSRRPAA